MAHSWRGYADFKREDVKEIHYWWKKGGVPLMTIEYVLKENNLYPGKDVEVDISIQFALMGELFFLVWGTM